MKYIIFFLPIIVFLFFADFSYAQNFSSGIANYIKIIDKDTPDGSIVASEKGGYILSKTPYDPLMFGVITEKPAVEFQSADIAGSKPVVTSGKAFVRVSTVNGIIREGDLVTASATPGVGQK